MSEDPKKGLKNLGSLLHGEQARTAEGLSPEIRRVLDSLVQDFSSEAGSLDGPAREAFSWVTLEYGQRLDYFLQAAR